MDGDDWTSPTEREKTATVGAVMERPMTVREYAITWMKRSTRLRPTTRDQYERHLRLRIIPGLGKVPLIELNRERVLTWWNSLRPFERADL